MNSQSWTPFLLSGTILIIPPQSAKEAPKVLTLADTIAAPL
jgi:hypothetical protein